MTKKRFVSPYAPPEGYERELLTILAEECAEITQRVTKALRFGLAEVQPGQARTNVTRISLEVGDFLEVFARMVLAGLIDEKALDEGIKAKARQLDEFMQHQPPARAK